MKTWTSDYISRPEISIHSNLQNLISDNLATERLSQDTKMNVTCIRNISLPITIDSNFAFFSLFLT